MGSGFDLIERQMSVPKLPVSKREIRKGSTTTQEQHSQPIIIIETGPREGEDDLPISPIAFGSPVAASMSNYSRIRSDPSRIIKRSVSEMGNFSNAEKIDPPETNPPSPSFRSMFSAQKGSDMSLSFSQRRKPFSNRALLMQIGERRKSYRKLTVEEEEDEDDDTPQPPQRQLSPHKQLQAQAQPSTFPSDDEDFEGTMPLKAEPKPLTVKKRSTSKDRLNKQGGGRTYSTLPDAPDTDDHVDQLPTRKSSLNNSRRLRTRKNSLSDSTRSNGSNRSSKRRLRSKSDDVATSPTKGALSPERTHQRSARRLSEKGGVRRSGSRSNKKTGRGTSGTSDEAKKHSSRCKNRRTVGRRASMTGNIVDMDEESPREKRRASMDHLRSNASAYRPRRRNTMDHYRPSPTSSTSPSDSGIKPRSRVDAVNTLSSREMKLSTHMSDGKASSFSARLPFGEEETETTKDTSDTRELSNSFRMSSVDRPLSRKSSTGSRGKSKEKRSHSSRRNVGRNRSDLERQRSSSRNREQAHHHEQLQDKTVTVAEILALVASTPHPAAVSHDVIHSKPSSRTRKSRSNDQFDVSSRSAGSINTSSRSSKSSKSRGRSADSPRDKKREKSRSSSRKPLSSNFYRLRKGKRVDHQPEEAPSQKESPGRRKGGKESRNRWGVRRGSAK